MAVHRASKLIGNQEQVKTKQKNSDDFVQSIDEMQSCSSTIDIILQKLHPLSSRKIETIVTMVGAGA